jgi:ABC-type nitrate/sulfonate/bicarbonate transport system substrate-binding protein
MRRSWYWVGSIVALLVIASAFIYHRNHTESALAPLKVAMSPYQDLAMIVNIAPLKLEQKYGTKVQLMTMGWEDIPPAVASAGTAADIGFGSYVEYLTKYEKINAGSSDPVLFIYPLYVFKGGAFVTFNDKIPSLSRQDITTAGSANAKRILESKIGTQKASLYEMMVYDLAVRHKVAPSSLRIVDTPLDQGFLAAERGDLDIAEVGLTQMTEAERRGGRVVFDMEELGFADITGFIVKKSVYERRQKDVDNLIKMWFDCVAYVYKDIDRNSTTSLAYLNRNASTRYTLAEYKAALGQEYLPNSVALAHNTFVGEQSQFSAERIGTSVNRYLVDNGTVAKATPLPSFAEIKN